MPTSCFVQLTTLFLIGSPPVLPTRERMKTVSIRGAEAETNTGVLRAGTKARKEPSRICSD
jgi:hypothetical protein